MSGKWVEFNWIIRYNNGAYIIQFRNYAYWQKQEKKLLIYENCSIVRLRIYKSRKLLFKVFSNSV